MIHYKTSDVLNFDLNSARLNPDELLSAFMNTVQSILELGFTDLSVTDGRSIQFEAACLSLLTVYMNRFSRHWENVTAQHSARLFR